MNQRCRHDIRRVNRSLDETGIELVFLIEQAQASKVLRSYMYKCWPTFSLGYLLLLVFWWSVVFALVREIAFYHPVVRYQFSAGLCYLFLPLALGPAFGGLVLRMRFGFYAGLCICAAMWL